MTAGDTRSQIIGFARRMNAAGLNQGTSGNLSNRLGDGFLITPTSMDYDDLDPQDVVHLDLQGVPDRANIRRPSSEWRFHRDIYNHRADVAAIVHCHAPYATALSLLGQPIPAVHYMITIFGGDDVPCAPYRTFGTQDLSDAILDTLGSGFACLMANHGMLTVGETLEQAFWRAQELEALSRQYLLASQVGEPVVLTPQQLDDARHQMKMGYGQT